MVSAVARVHRPEELEAVQRKVQGASRERMLREFAEVVEVLTAEQLVVLVLEDLHWSDVSTLDLLAFLARRKEAVRLLILGTYRPVETLNDGHPLKGIVQELYAHELATEIALGVLSETDIAAYLQTRLSVLSPLALGVALMAIKGYAAPEVEAAYARARTLCQQLEDAPQLFPLLHGLLFFYSMRGELQTALEVDRQSQALAQHSQNPIALVGAYYASGLLSFLRGEFAAAQTSWDQCLAFYEPQQAPVHLLLYGYAPSVAATMLSAFVRWLHGYPE